MANLYVWLKFFHLFGLAVFLFAHGVSGGASVALRAPVSPDTRRLLQLSQRSSFVANPALLVVIATGVWMTFTGHFWGRGWLWAAIVVLVALLAAMGFISRPYYMARDAARQPDEVVADRLRQARPVAAIWIGSIGLALLVLLMVFKPF